MTDQLRAIAFDLDAASLQSLRQVLPDWQIDVVEGASTSSFSGNWNPGAADLLVVMAREDADETLELCRLLVCSGDLSVDRTADVAEPIEHSAMQRRPDATLIVLVSPQQETVTLDALRAIADCCLVLPVGPKELMGAVVRAHTGHVHAGHVEPAMDRWRDDGGEA
jgi:DNA-binding NarL/FixJ family response regulator